MKTLLNSLNRTANAAKISGGGSSHVLKHLFTIVTLLLTVGVGNAWGGDNQCGFWGDAESYVQFWVNGETVTFTCRPDGVSDLELGYVDHMYLSEIRALTWKYNDGNVCNVTMHYGINTSRHGSTGSDYTANYNNDGYDDWTGKEGDDKDKTIQQFKIRPSGLNLVEDLTPGQSYYLDFYLELQGNLSSSSECYGDQRHRNNNGGNYHIHFTVSDTKSKFTKGSFLYFDARNLTNWKAKAFDTKFFFKKHNNPWSDIADANGECLSTNALEDWVYYIQIPDGEDANYAYEGAVQINRVRPEGDPDEIYWWNNTNIALAGTRANANQNCLTGSGDAGSNWDPTWTTYCPPMSSVSLSDNGTTNWGGNGSSETPYLVPTDGDIKVHVTASASALDDANMTRYFLFKKESSAIGEGSASTEKTITASSTTSTKEAVTVEAYNYYNSTSGTSVASTAIYYEARTPYTISYNKGTPAASISGSRESEIKLKDVTFTLPGAIFTRTGYTQTGWATSDGGAKAYELGASYTANEAVTLYPFWTPKTYTVRLEGMEADGESLPIDVNVTYDAVLTTLENKHTKAHYDFAGYWAASDNHGENLTVQLIDANGNWIPGVTGYTGNDGEGHPTWVHDNSISLFADWTEHPYTITTSVSPAGAGTLSCASTIEAHWVTPTSTITATANPAWKFVRWEYSDYVGPATGTGLDNTVQIKAAVDGTLTAVFEPRFCLVGSIYDNSGNGGMPGWVDYTADFTVNSYTDLSTMNLTCVRTLDPNTTYKFEVHDKVKRQNLGFATAGTYIGNQSLLFNTQNKDVMLRVNGHGECTFTISALSSGDLYPTVSVAIPPSHLLNLEWAYVRLNGDLYKTNDAVGGTVSAQTTESGRHFAIHNGEYVAHGGDITYTATPATGYSFEGWYNDNYNTRFSTTNPYTSYNISVDENVEAKFVEKATTVTLSNDGHGHVEINGATVTSTTVGVTTHRELTAVPDEGYKFNSWTIVSGEDISLSATNTNPTTLSGNGTGAASGQDVRANFVERWALSAQSEGWGSAEFSIANVSIVAGKAIGYVDIALPANTDMQFKMVDKLTGDDYMSGSDRVFFMTNGNSHNWSFATDKMWNCGITTAGAGTYRFIWNITDKKMTVTYPNFVIYRTGDKEDDPRAQDTDVESYDGGTIEKAIEYRMKVHTLDEWTTLCLPFTVSAVKVWDDGDGAYYDIKPFYRFGGKFYTGHYIIRKPATVTNYAIETFEENWQDPESAVGFLPSANTPYIIQWHDKYFFGKYISFFSPTGQDIPSAFSIGEAPSADDVVNVYGNNTMHTGTVMDAYLLEPDYGPSGAWLREAVGTNRMVLPFECFIRANETTTTRYRILRRGAAPDDTPTGWEVVMDSEPMTAITVYTLTGIPVARYDGCSFAEAARRLNAEQAGGIYILRSENESVKLMIGGQ